MKVLFDAAKWIALQYDRAMDAAAPLSKPDTEENPYASPDAGRRRNDTIILGLDFSTSIIQVAPQMAAGWAHMRKKLVERRSIRVCLYAVNDLVRPIIMNCRPKKLPNFETSDFEWRSTDGGYVHYGSSLCTFLSEGIEEAQRGSWWRPSSAVFLLTDGVPSDLTEENLARLTACLKTARVKSIPVFVSCFLHYTYQRSLERFRRRLGEESKVIRWKVKYVGGQGEMETSVTDAFRSMTGNMTRAVQ